MASQLDRIESKVDNNTQLLSQLAIDTAVTKTAVIAHEKLDDARFGELKLQLEHKRDWVKLIVSALAGAVLSIVVAAVVAGFVTS